MTNCDKKKRKEKINLSKLTHDMYCSKITKKVDLINKSLIAFRRYTT